MPLQYDRRRISVKGGGNLQIRQIDPTPAATFSQLGFLSEVVFSDAHEMVESRDDSGRFIDTKTGGETVKITGILKQTSKEEIDAFAAVATLYHEIYYAATLNNTRVQEFLIPVARIRPGVTLEFKSATERTIAVEIFALAPATALTRTPTSWNTVQWAPYIVQEGAVAVGAPSDAGSVPQAAI